MKRDVNVYKACDLAIKAMNRENLESFGRLKMADWDRVNIIRTVVAVYRQSALKARKRYYEVAFEAYIIGMMLCGVESKEAHKMAEKGITIAWVDDVLQRTDLLTLYRFETETERKAYRLAETLEAAQDRDQEINKALRYWSQQLGQFAINVTDYAVMQAFEDYGLEEAEWQTAMDERVCHACNELDGKVFKLTEIPPKPHYACRCRLKPVFKDE